MKLFTEDVEFIINYNNRANFDVYRSCSSVLTQNNTDFDFSEGIEGVSGK